jgi:hypothetical protein
MNPQATRREKLENFLPPEHMVPYRPMEEKAWARLRRRGLIDLLWHFIDWRDLRLHRGVFPDIVGFGWAGIYRSMLVPSIAAASFKNEGHFRARGRISGTESFFSAAFRHPQNSPALQKILRVVNVRHHVAGVVGRMGGSVEVLSHYESAFMYVSTAFIEGIRRGYAAHGVPPEGRKGRRIAGDLATMLYQIAGMAGLSRVPKDLAGHEIFRDNYESHLRSLTRSHWMETQAQQLAKRIFPFTAALAGVTLEAQYHRYLDRETAEFLFPDPSVIEEIRPDYEDMLEWFDEKRKGYGRALAKQLFHRAPPTEDTSDLDPLWDAYWRAPDDSIEARLIGALLLHAINSRQAGSRWHHPETLHLEAGEAIVRQGDPAEFCFVLLETTEPLFVTRRAAGEEKETEIAQVVAPTLLNEIGMWRGKAASATVSCRKAAELRVLRLDRREFEALKSNPGFWTATASMVQKRLNVSMRQIGTLLDGFEVGGEDPEFSSLLLLLQYVNGDSSVNLERVPGIYPETSLAECIDLLRQKASALHDSRTDNPALGAALEHLLRIIG